MKKFLNHPWTIGVGTVLLGFLLTIVWDKFKDIELLTTICALLNLKVKLWWILAFIIIASFFMILLKLRKKISANKENAQEKPLFLTYTSAHLQGFDWQWTWEKNDSGQYVVDELHPLCKTCQTPIYQGDYLDGRWLCPRCNATYKNPTPNITAVELLIQNNVQRGHFIEERKFNET